MKFLKYFEGITDNKLLPLVSKFKIGDYVFIKKGRSYPKWQNLMFNIVSYDPQGGLWEIGLSEQPDVQLWFPPNSLRKARNFEIDAKKYNM